MSQAVMQLRPLSLMIAVAIAAVICAAAREETAPSAGIAITVSCIAFLTYKKYPEALAARRAKTLLTSRMRKAWLLLGSGCKATLVIGLSDTAFLAGYYGFLRLVDGTHARSHWSASNDPNYMLKGGAIGVILALCVASSLKHTFWPQEGAAQKPIALCANFWHIVVTVLIVLSLALV